VAIGSACAPTTPVVKRDFSKFVYPEPPSQPRFKLLNVIYTDLDIREKSSSELLFGESVTFVLGKPHGVAVDRDGNIYVSDTMRNDVFIINPEKKSIGSLFNPEGWKTPMHVAVDNESGLIGVANLAVGRVIISDMATKSVKFSLGAGVLTNPVSLAFDPGEKRIYVADTTLHGVFAYSYGGEYIGRIIEAGTAPGYIYYPSGMAMDKEGHIVVVDTMNFRVQTFDRDGTFVRSVGEHGDAPGMFARPKGVSFSHDGVMFVTDAAFGNFQVFNPDGRVLIYVGVTGKQIDRFQIPQGIFVDNETDKLYVVDQIGRNLKIYQYLSKRYLEAHPDEVVEPVKVPEKKAPVKEDTGPGMPPATEAPAPEAVETVAPEASERAPEPASETVTETEIVPADSLTDEMTPEMETEPEPVPGN
jgi:sugar lactone lactonase YvrE